MQRANKNPGAADAARGAGVPIPSGGKHRAAAARRQPGRRRAARTFAAWCRTDAPHRLGLDPDTVARILRAMSRPEMQGVSTLDGLVGALQWLRRPFYFDDPLAWQRFTLAARTMWLAHRGRLPPVSAVVASAAPSAPAATIAADATDSTLADLIIARGRKPC
jgi:hypothetical protein